MRPHLSNTPTSTRPRPWNGNSGRSASYSTATPSNPVHFDKRNVPSQAKPSISGGHSPYKLGGGAGTRTDELNTAASPPMCLMRPDRAYSHHLAEEIAFAFAKSFFCALVKKLGLDFTKEALKTEPAWLKRVLALAALTVGSAWLGAQLFGYSFLFSLGMEVFNCALRETGNARFSILSGIIFYGPDVLYGALFRPNTSPSTWSQLAERGMKAGFSAAGGFTGWYMAGLFTEPKKTKRRHHHSAPHQPRLVPVI